MGEQNSQASNYYLYHCYIEQNSYKEESYLLGHGNVYGHKKIMDTVYIHTSPVQDIVYDEAAGEILLYTMNSLYHCPLQYWDWEKQDQYPSVIDNYNEIRDKYSSIKEEFEVADGDVLLVLSDYDAYYYHDLVYKKDGECYETSMGVHVGTFQDSVLLYVKKNKETVDKFDLRYFPHYKNIEFYSEYLPDGANFYIENVGHSDLYAKFACDTYKIGPGERKLIVEENAETEKVSLPGGDLYPAFLDDNLNFPDN